MSDGHEASGSDLIDRTLELRRQTKQAVAPTLHNIVIDDDPQIPDAGILVDPFLLVNKTFVMGARLVDTGVIEVDSEPVKTAYWVYYIPAGSTQRSEAVFAWLFGEEDQKHLAWQRLNFLTDAT